ncbi:MAG: sugar kinase, partial [Glutamicibacter arilaitensis]
RLAGLGLGYTLNPEEPVYQRGAPLSTQHLQIRTSLSWEVGALRGASMIAINRALSPAAIERSALALISAS